MKTKERIGGSVPCRICQRPIEQKAGRGRVKGIHEYCGQYESAVRRVERFLEHEAYWMDAEAIKAQRKIIQGLMNRYLRADNPRQGLEKGALRDAELIIQAQDATGQKRFDLSDVDEA